MATPSRLSWLHRARALCLLGATALLVSGFLWGGDLLAGAQSSTTGPDLAQQYLNALGPAGKSISTVEANLKALPITVSVSQVKAVVAPLSKALAPVEALIQSGTSSPTGTSLESLGKPTIAGAGGAKCNSYTTPALGGHLVVEGVEYQNGFQMTTPSCQEIHVGYTWRIGKKYANLKAQIGYDLSNACTGSTIRFLGNDLRYLPFTVSGRITETLSLPAKGLASIAVNVSQQAQLTVQVVFGCLNGIGGLEGTSTVDVVNDQLLS